MWSMTSTQMLGAEAASKFRSPRYDAESCPGFEYDSVFGYCSMCKVCKQPKAQHPGDVMFNFSLSPKDIRERRKRASMAKRIQQRFSLSRRSSTRSERSSIRSERSNSRALEEVKEEDDEDTDGRTSDSDSDSDRDADGEEEDDVVAPLPVMAAPAKRASSRRESLRRSLRLSTSSKRSSKRSSTSSRKSFGEFDGAAAVLSKSDDDEDDDDDDDDAKRSSKRSSTSSKRGSVRESLRRSSLSSLSSTSSTSSKRSSSKRESLSRTSLSRASALGTLGTLAAIREDDDDDDDTDDNTASDEEEDKDERVSSKRVSSKRASSKRASSKRVSSRRQSKTTDVSEIDLSWAQEYYDEEDAAVAGGASRDSDADEEDYSAWVGRTVRALYHDDECFYPGKITEYEEEDRTFTVQFDHGTLQVETEFHDVQPVDDEADMVVGGKAIDYSGVDTDDFWAACKADDIVAVEHMIQTGTDFEKPCPDDGKSPLVLACMADAGVVVKKLLQSGAEDTTGEAYISSNDELKSLLCDYGFGKTGLNAKLLMRKEAGSNNMEAFDIVRERRHLSASAVERDQDRSKRSRKAKLDAGRGSSWPKATSQELSQAQARTASPSIASSRTSGLKKMLCFANGRNSQRYDFDDEEVA